jgi:hypothetical protein
MDTLSTSVRRMEASDGKLQAELRGAPRWLRLASTALALAAFGWAAFVMTSLRTMSYGGYPVFRDEDSSLGTLVGAFGFYVLPVVVVLTARRRPLRWLRATAAVIAGAVLFAELWSGIEEARWRATAPALAAEAEPIDPERLDLFAMSLGVSNATIYQQRWWPFRHHSLYYDPTTQEFGGHD